ncbi:MAG: DUF423 domain-containing protein [Gammaproteobacteria bacterium]
MRSIFLFLGALSALTGVAMGAFGAHGLKGVLSPESLSIYQTGVSYQMWHALGLCGIAQLRHRDPKAVILDYAGWLMFCGILLFSGSLYLLTLLDLKWLGMITPVGGLGFLMAWLLVAVFAVRTQSSSRYT